MAWGAWVLSMKFSIHNLFWPTPIFLDLHHPCNSSHFWAVAKFYGLTNHEPTPPAPPTLFRRLAVTGCMQNWNWSVFATRLFAESSCNSKELTCLSKEMKFNSWICNTNSYNLWTKSCILSQLTFWCNLQLVNPTRNSWMI